MLALRRPCRPLRFGGLSLIAACTACGSDDGKGADERNGGGDGNASGGATTGGTSHAGSSPGGATSGGATAGGTTSGGAPAGGAPTSGAAGAAAPSGGRAGTGTGGTAGSAGGESSSSGAPTAGMAGAGATAGSSGADGAGGALVWPNETSRANSDQWIQQNHDRISQLRPKVLVIDLESTEDATATTLVNAHIAALKEASSFHKYENTAAEPVLAYELVKIVPATKGTRIDYQAWNTQEFADSNLQLKDPADPSGPNLTLCGLFETGVINEVWCMASSDPKCGETQESKQAYEMDGTKVANTFRNVSNGADITNLGCRVTARITDFNSGRGAGCHQHAMGHAWERYMDSNAIPMLGKQARRFLNMDLDTRVGAPFSSFYRACTSNSMQLTDCIVWDSQIQARSGPSASQGFELADMSGGCGNAHFYPNTTGTYSYDANMPDPTVLTSCENYGLKNGPDGKDLTTPYTNAMTDMFYGRSQRTCPADQPACDDDCGGHGTTYLYQNFPSYGTQARNDDDTPMQNWWVYLFY